MAFGRPWTVESHGIAKVFLTVHSLTIANIYLLLYNVQEFQPRVNIDAPRSTRQDIPHLPLIRLYYLSRRHHLPSLRILRFQRRLNPLLCMHLNDCNVVIRLLVPAVRVRIHVNRVSRATIERERFFISRKFLLLTHLEKFLTLLHHHLL